MSRIDYSKIRQLLEQLSINNEHHRIEFTMVPINSSSVYEENGTKQVDLKANVDVEVKATGEKAAFPVDLLKIPHYGESGFTIKGKSKQVISSYTISYGWYIIPPNGNVKMDHLKLTTERGPNLTIYQKDYVLWITNGKKASDPSVPLSVFLKALTGSSFAELAHRIGVDNIYSSVSFGEKEPLRSECIDRVIKGLFPEFMKNKKDYEYSQLSGEAKFAILQDRLLDSDKMYLGSTTGVRLKRSISFKERCNNLYLAKTIETHGRRFESGMSLDSRTLETMDYLPLDSIEVIHSSKNLHYKVKKESIYNFRALGFTLEQEVNLPSRTLEKGTVLTLEDLKELEQTALSKIRVSYDGKIVDCMRMIFDGSLKVEDIISMVQVYIDSLNGLDLYDNIYGLANQNLDTLDIKIRSLVTANCRKVIGNIVNSISTMSEDMDLLTRILQMPKLPLDELINYVANSETREAQQSEINNIIQKISKEQRVSKNVKRSSAGMVNVQESQFSRLDPIESPESSKIGIVQTMTYFAKTDEFGFITAPFIRVNNGVIVDKTPVYLSADDQRGQFIAEWNETFHTVDENGNKVKKTNVMALADETMMEVPIEDVKYMQVGPYDTMSPARMQVSFPEHSNQKRMLMGSNHQKQTVVSINNERSFVSSGGDSLMNDGLVIAEDLLSEFYDSMDIGINVPKSEFIRSTLILKDVEIVKNLKILSLEVDGFPGMYITKEIPFMQKAPSGAMFSYLINTTTGLRFKEDDVIAHSLDYDIRKYKLHKHVDFGNMNIDTEKFGERAIGLAKNLIVAYKTHESSSIDDAIVISDELVGNHALTTIDLHQITYELQNERSNKTTGISEIESFGFINEPPSVSMTMSGLPEIGTILKPGDVVIGVKIEKRESSKAQGTKTINTRSNHVVLDDTVEGQVVHAIIEGKKATVLLAALKPIEKGDKLAGRHGNKGVIARIIPAHHMPYDPVTGLRVQVILNPQGVPSRSNISQILEAVLGFASKKLGQITIVTPYKGKTLEFVKDMAAKTDTKPMMLRDGRTGHWFKRAVNVGVLYMLKLEHMVSHKIKGVGISSKLDPVFNQPSKGGGGQAIGEYETWVLMNLGVTKILQDLFSVQSDDLTAINTLRNALAEDVHHVDVEGNNNNDHLFQVIFRGLGVEPTYDEDGSLWFRPMTDRMIRALSNSPIDINNKASLESADIFGPTSNNITKFENRTTWSWMPLHCEIVHPFFVVKGKINKFILAKKKVIKDGEERIEGGVATTEMIKDLIACRCVIETTEVNGRSGFLFSYVESESTLTGMEALVHILRNTSLSSIKEYYHKKISNATKEEIIANYKTIVRGIEDFESAGLSLEDFIVTSLPVIPLAFRPKAKFDHIMQDFDFYYSRIIDEVVKYKSSSLKTQEAVYNIYMRIVEFCGLTYGKEAKVEKQYKPLLKYFTGREGPDSKHGRVRESMLKKRVLFSGRTVIVPSSNMHRPPNKIGVPYMLCLKIWNAHLVNLLRKTFSQYDVGQDEWKQLLDVVATNRINFNKLVDEFGLSHHMTSDELYNKIYSVVSIFVEGYVNPDSGEVEVEPRVVLAGRQPSLHKFSIRAYYPVIVGGKCIEVHPLVCKGYNADFDGDQMWLVGLVNDEACQEAIEKMSPKDGIINPKDGSVILEHSQDIRLGVYYATMLHDNVDSITKHPKYHNPTMYFYNNEKVLESDVDLEYISIHDLVCFSKNGRTYLSTAGRVLFNSLFPDDLGFTDKPFKNVLGIPNIKEECYNELLYDGLVSGSGGSRKTPVYCSLSKITSWSYKTYGRDENLEVFQRISEFGFKYSDDSGISLYLEDFIDNPDTDKLIARADKYAEIINQRYYMGAISDEERKEELIYLFTEMANSVKTKFMETFPRNNNMFIMFDSGARGNQGQIMQASGVIGVLTKSKDETLETPILSNYAKGISCFETLQSSFSTRTGVASTQNETSVSGELTRLAVYMGGGFTVVEHDCGQGGIEDFKIKYGAPTGRVIGPQGDTSAAILKGKTVVGDDKVLRHLKNFLDDGKITDKCIEILLKKKIKNVECTDGSYKIFYKLDSMMPSILLNREAENLPGLHASKFITSKTITSLERDNPETIRVRTILGCKSVGGVCARCYGLKYDTEQYPYVGEIIGIESAQSIGEPASQLTLSLFHKGGAAGESIDKGVELYSSTLSSGFPTRKMKGAKLASRSGYITVNADKERPVITDERGISQVEFVDTDLLVDSGEYVEEGEPISSGFVMPLGPDDDRLINPTLTQIRSIQMALLEVHFRIFELNNIKVYARHFEMFVRLQTSLVTAINSEDPQFKEGAVYELNEILKANGKVDFGFSVSRDSEVIKHFGGVETLLAHGRLADSLGEVVVTGTKSNRSSLIGSLMQGQSVNGGERKIFISPKYINSSKDLVSISGEENDLVSNILLSENIIEEVEPVVASLGDINWDSLLLEDDDTKPQILEPISDINSEERTPVGKDTSNKAEDREDHKLGSMNIF